MPALQLFLLGALDIQYDGQQLPKPPTRKSQSLFAYLALHRQRPQLREHLADMFWGDWPERKARRSLTTALWQIRRSLPDAAALLSDPQTVQFDPHVDLWLDADEFEGLAARQDLASLQSAASLYRGDLLEGFYDDWVLTIRYRMDALFGDVLARLMARQEAAGEHQDALATARRLLDHDPFREDAHRLLMRAFCRLGQRNAALEQYRRCQEIVEQELGGAPMIETTELYQAILDGHFEIWLPAATIPSSDVQGPLPLRPGTSPLEAVISNPLVGREQEMKFLQERWQAVQQGRGRLVLIGGEAGVGKTRLIEDFAGRLRWQGARVLWGCCYEFERLLPYQPVVEALGGVMPAISRPELGTHPAWVLAEVARLVPELLEKVPGVDATPALRSEEERVRLFDGLVRFLAQLSARSCLLLTLEDLHWATESTLHLVHYLARHLATHQVLIVGTYRPEALGHQHPLASLQQELIREGMAWPLSLKPLSPEAIEHLVVEMSGAGAAVAPLARWLHAETEGNPLFLMEILKALFEARRIRLEDDVWRGDFARISAVDLLLPAGVSETIRARTRWLDDKVQEALRTAAVLGREFDLELLDAVWGQGEEATLEALDILLRRRLIEEGTGAQGRDYAFTHHKIQEVTYADLPLRHRQRLHTQAGLAMERLYGPQVDDLAAELAFHFQEGAAHAGQLRDKAIQYLLRAGDQARLAYAHQEAVGYYERALAWLKQQRQHELAARTLMKLGLAYHGAFEFGKARQAYEEGLSLWRRVDKSAQASGQRAASHPLRVSISEPISLDPAVAYDEASLTVIDLLFSGLLDLNPELDIVPDAAQSWDVLEEGRRYVFHLRDDLRWSDGTRVTATDFEYGLRRMLDRATGSFYATLLYDLKGARAFHQGGVATAESVGVRVADDVTLIMELEEPTGHFLQLLARCGMPVPRHVVEAHGKAWTSIVHLVTNGPYVLESWEAGRSMVLVRNPAYGGRFDGNVHRLCLTLMPSSSWCERLALYDSDKLDAVTISAFPPEELDAARQGRANDYVTLPRFETRILGFDVSRPPLDDVRVRCALALAIDRELLVEMVWGGHVSAATGGFVPAGMPGHSAGIGLPHNPELARGLLAKAGYPGGRSFPLLDGILTGAMASSLGEFLHEQWREKLGIETTYRVMDLHEAVDRVYSKPPLLANMAWTASYPDPHDFLGVAASHAQSFTRWQSERYDHALDEARRITNQQDRMQLYRIADRILIEEVGVIPLAYGRSHLLVKPWLKGYSGSQVAKVFWKDVVIEQHEIVGRQGDGMEDSEC